MSGRTPEEFAHLEWLGYLQPMGLLVSLPALAAAQAIVSREVLPLQEQLRAHVAYDPEVASPRIESLPRFVSEVLGWRDGWLIATADSGAHTIPSVVIPAYNEVLTPSFAVREPEPDDPAQPWMLLVMEVPYGTDLDRISDSGSKWQATPHMKFERLLRDSGVCAGLITNGSDIRLVYSPKGESSGYATFRLLEMCTVAGRPILAAFHMLLSSERLFILPKKRRLIPILTESRKYQAAVSSELARQVLAALHELARGFQGADDHVHGKLLSTVVEHDPDHVYAGLLTVMMRLVFLLFAEERDLLPVRDPVYAESYSVLGLFNRLREDEGHYPDSMDRRYGAWAHLLTLFRLVHGGGRHKGMIIPARAGYLFDLERYPFLEGGESGSIPTIPDRVVHRILSSLLIVNGERISYRALNVEQIGSVYEAMMGFTVQRATGPSLAIRQKDAKKGGASFTIDLEALVKLSASDRTKELKEKAGQELSGDALTLFKKAKTVQELATALEKKVDASATPAIVPEGTLVLQPSDARRRSGSHYTPVTLTRPIVAKALEPVLSALGEKPTPEQLLSLKILDPAIGSGAFLVEVCRQLGAKLAESWGHHHCTPEIPPDEDELLHAVRLVAQSCVYGVDRNPMAADLAKLSIWLATMAKDHPFTFVDHAIKCGDSLAGVSLSQIGAYTWKGPGNGGFLSSVRKKLDGVREKRKAIQDAGETSDAALRELNAAAEKELTDVRMLGDSIIAAFFAGDNDKKRKSALSEFGILAQEWLKGGAFGNRLTEAVTKLRVGEKGFVPFHWEIEFPEVFERANSGFDCIVGNPPFAGKNTISEGASAGYLDWLKTVHEEAHGNSDLVAHFFRRSFDLLGQGGTFGLIATNTISQGDTRSTGLRWICTHGGTIYSAKKRYKWPNIAAAVVVSVVHVRKGPHAGPFELDGRPVERITAYLFHAGGSEDPASLVANNGKSFIGSYVLGMGFTFDDTDKDGVANPIRLMQELIVKDSRNAERIFPYIGGEEVNNHPEHKHHRYVINFGDMTEEEARRWPDLMGIVEQKVKPQRATDKREQRKKYWWRFAETTPALFAALKELPYVLVNSQVSAHHSFALLPSTIVYAHTLNVFSVSNFTGFAVMQSRLHELWTRFFASSLEDRLRYTPSDCFETFPFPRGFESDPKLEEAGRRYYEFRAQLMLANNEGLTKTYNRFHDPEKQTAEIRELQRLHDEMDRAVFAAYGDDLGNRTPPPCLYLLERENDGDSEDHGDTNQKTTTKHHRYRWPDEFREEVLARLLALNAKRAEGEQGGSLVMKTQVKQGALF